MVSENEDWIRKAKFLSTQARDPAPHYEHSELGFNYRLSNICAGIGRGQLKVLDERVSQRREVFNAYVEKLGKLPGIAFLSETAGAFSNRWLTTILVDPAKSGGKTREDLRLTLEAVNIESRPLWKPMHLQPVFKGCPEYSSGVSENLFKNGLCLPSGSNLTRENLVRVIGEIETVLAPRPSQKITRAGN